jgi:hypothetical protein
MLAGPARRTRRWAVAALVTASVIPGRSSTAAGPDGAVELQEIRSTQCFSKKMQRESLYAVSFPPGTPISTIVHWWSMKTCQGFLLPKTLGDRKVSIFSYGCVVFEEARGLFAAMLESAELGLVPAGRFKKVIAAPRPAESSRRVFARLSIQQLTIDAVVASPTHPIALVSGPKGQGQFLKLGDHVGKQAGQVIEITPDRVVFALPATAASGDPANASREILQAVPPGAGWEIGAGWVGNGR